MPRADGLVALKVWLWMGRYGLVSAEILCREEISVCVMLGSQVTGTSETSVTGKQTPAGEAASLEGQREGEMQVYF